jgi:5-methylcytosine-specific restriction endonuclease McrA
MVIPADYGGTLIPQQFFRQTPIRFIRQLSLKQIESWIRVLSERIADHLARYVSSGRGDLEFARKELSLLEKDLAKFQRVMEQRQDTGTKYSSRKDKRTREMAGYVRRDLPSDHGCPYCRGSLGLDYQTDHIYPVSKGGGSTRDNLVNVCSSCNQKKGRMTLLQFINKYKIHRQTIESDLLALGKVF